MYTRDPSLQALLDLMFRAIVADPMHSGDAERTIGTVRERLRRIPEPVPAAEAPMRLPVCALLDEMLAAATEPLSRAFFAVEPHLAWYQRRGDLGDERFRACHANAMLAGPGGLESRE